MQLNWFGWFAGRGYDGAPLLGTSIIECSRSRHKSGRDGVYRWQRRVGFRRDGCDEAAGDFGVDVVH